MLSPPMRTVHLAVLVQELALAPALVQALVAMREAGKIRRVSEKSNRVHNLTTRYQLYLLPHRAAASCTSLDTRATTPGADADSTSRGTSGFQTLTWAY